MLALHPSILSGLAPQRGFAKKNFSLLTQKRIFRALTQLEQDSVDVIDCRYPSPSSYRGS